MQKLLVLGVGNILLMDEGIGVKAVTELLGETWPENVTFIDGGTFTQDIFYLFQEYDHLIILDVVRTGKEPGTIFRLSEDDLVQNEDQSLSLHDIDLLDSLRMAELLGNRPTLTIIGIEPEKIDWSMELTPTLEKAYPKFLEAARREIRNQLEAMAASDKG
ncbi:MAG: NiFeSe hydrogenase maturation protease [Desulfovibrionales bacterium]